MALMITITSCGSFDAVSYNDGIYGDSYDDEEIDQVSYEENSGSYYKNLFAEKAEQYGQNFGQDSVFTDVDSYSSQSYDQSNPDYTSNYGGGESGFGETPSTVVINYYDNGWNNWGGWNRGFGWGGNSWYGGYGWNNWGGWNRGFGWGGNPWHGGYGWNNWGGWNQGFGWGGGGFGWNYWGGYNNGFAWGNRWGQLLQ
ncbi:vitellogenin II precursor [Nonlabens ulvanivorans]|uniref:Vitellogenin II n=1 Tax=Nonlabens ulvanivorans TaxID=906888 RepID=A0A081DDJ7_NONUL|nr:vitellogenin II precursor [Nonlabens ulvanivorans]